MIRYLAAVALVTLGMFVHVILFNLRLSDDIGLSEQVMGRLGAAMSIGTAVGTLVWGALASRWGLKPTILYALTGLAAALTGRALLRDLDALAVDSFLTGLFLAGWFVTNSPAIAALAAEGRGAAAFSMNVALGISVGAFGGLLAGTLPGLVGSTQTAMLAAPVLVLCGLSCAAATRFPHVASHGLSLRMSLRMSPASRAFTAKYVAAVALWYGFLAGFGPFFNIYLRNRIGASTQAIGTVFSAAQIAQGAAALSMAWVMGRLGVVRTVVGTQLLASACILAFLPIRILPLAAAAYMIYGSLQVMSEPGLQHFLMDGVPAVERPAVNAVNLLAMFLTNAAVAAGAGALISNYGYNTLFVWLAALGAAAALTFAFVFQPAPQVTPTDSAPDASVTDNPDTRLP